MLRLEDVVLRQGGWSLAADFELPQGGVTAVIGPSGGGKSTLLSLIAGFLTPTEGRIFWDGTELTYLRPGARPVSMVFQEHNLFPHLTVFQNVALGQRPGLRLKEGERDAVLSALARVGLQGLEKRRPGELSGGQRSRVALARVLVMDRPLLLLDEPFAALGPALRAEMGALVADLARDTGKSVLMVTHAPEDARNLAERAVFVDAGQVAPPQRTEVMFADPSPALRTYLG